MLNIVSFASVEKKLEKYFFTIVQYLAMYDQDWKKNYKNASYSTEILALRNVSKMIEYVLMHMKLKIFGMWQKPAQRQKGEQLFWAFHIFGRGQKQGETELRQRCWHQPGRYISALCDTMKGVHWQATDTFSLENVGKVNTAYCGTSDVSDVSE